MKNNDGDKEVVTPVDDKEEVKTTIVVGARSAGFEAGNKATISINDEAVDVANNESNNQRGLHIVVVDASTGEVTNAKAYDTYKSSEVMEYFIDNLHVPDNHIVVAAC